MEEQKNTENFKTIIGALIAGCLFGAGLEIAQQARAIDGNQE